MHSGNFRGIDFNALARYLWALDAMRADRAPLPTIQWFATSGRYGGMAYGCAGRPCRIRMRVAPTCSVEWIAETLLHELIHCSCPKGVHHGELFCRRLIACAREAFGLDLDTAALLALPRGNHRKQAYAIDAAIVGALRVAGWGERLLQGYAAPLPPPPPPPEDPALVEARLQSTRQERRAERAKAREEHAREKLAEWERKLTAAKKLVVKWRRKVRYYEKRREEPMKAAAKKGS